MRTKRADEQLDTSSGEASDDPFARLAARFAERLGGQLEQMGEVWREHDYSALADLAHWLKGAGGTVGFKQFTAPARDLEAAAKSSDDQKIGAALRKLRDIAEPIPGVEFSSRFTDPPADEDQADTPDVQVDALEDEPIVSRLAGHPRMQPLIARFVGQLVEAADMMQEAWQSDDGETLLERSRWLKGSAGTLGFDVFTEPAEELQSCLVAGEHDRAQQVLEQLYVLIKRVQKGMQAADEQSEPLATLANSG